MFCLVFLTALLAAFFRGAALLFLCCLFRFIQLGAVSSTDKKIKKPQTLASDICFPRLNILDKLCRKVLWALEKMYINDDGQALV